MTILEPTLYANGALRLTRHGPRGGGNILVLEVDGYGKTKQVELTDDGADRLPEIARNLGNDAKIIFNHARGWLAAPTTENLQRGFVPFYHD